MPRTKQQIIEKIYGMVDAPYALELGWKECPIGTNTI